MQDTFNLHQLFFKIYIPFVADKGFCDFLKCTSFFSPFKNTIWFFFYNCSHYW